MRTSLMVALTSLVPAERCFCRSAAFHAASFENHIYVACLMDVDKFPRSISINLNSEEVFEAAEVFHFVLGNLELRY